MPRGRPAGGGRSPSPSRGGSPSRSPSRAPPPPPQSSGSSQQSSYKAPEPERHSSGGIAKGVDGNPPPPNELCEKGDIKPKVYAVRLMANRNMCWKWSDGSSTIQVSDECKENLDDPRFHFIFDTSMRVHSGVSQKEYGQCVDLSSSQYKTGDLVRGAGCGEAPTQKFLLNMNVFKKVFKGCDKGTTKPLKYYPSAYGRVLLMNSLAKCIGIEGSAGEFEGTHNLAVDECAADLKDQEWELVPVPVGGAKEVESYKAAVDQAGFEEADSADADGSDEAGPHAAADDGAAALAHAFAAEEFGAHALL